MTAYGVNRNCSALSRVNNAVDRIAVLFHRLGPYHHARLGAAAKLGHVDAVEFSKVDRTYAWSQVDGAAGFGRTWLFSDMDISDASYRAISRQLTRVLGEKSPDVVAIPGWSTPASLAAMEWCLSKRVPMVCMSESNEWDSRRWAIAEAIKRRIVSCFSAALAGGESSSDYLEALGLPSDRIVKGYDVVDNGYFERRSAIVRENLEWSRRRLKLPQRFFLASARFVPEKNLTGLLAAFADYRSRRTEEAWSLVILGDGRLRTMLMEEIRRLNICDSVVLPGFIQYDELPGYYGCADCFVLASKVEPWGLVVNEAMACGLPVLVSKNCGCAADLVQDGVNGWCFDPLATSELANLFEQVSSNTCNRSIMGTASREIVSGHSPLQFASGLWASARIAKSYAPTASNLPLRVLVRALAFR